MSEQFPEPPIDVVDTTEAQPSGALETQKAIINSELMWFGRLMDSDDIHSVSGTPYEGPCDMF